MKRADNSLSVLIGKSVARTASVQITDPSASSTFIASGEILILDATDAPLTAGTTIAGSKSIRIVQGDGATNPLVFSPRISGLNVTAFSGLQYVAPQEEIQYIGYNGSSGAIDVLNNNRYVVRIYFKHDISLWSEHAKILHQEYESDATATQLEIAQGFAQKYAQVFPLANTDIKVERVTDGTFTVPSAAQTLTVAQGSATVTASAAIPAWVAGDIIRIGGPSSTDPVYVIASVSGTTIVLDSPYQGASGTVANANCGEMSAVTAWGLKITGKAFPFSQTTVARFPYQKVSFDVTVQNFGATGITDAQQASLGNGTFEEVAEHEYFALGYDGWLSNRNAVPFQPQPRTNAVSGVLYNTITIKAYDASDFGPVSGVRPSPFEVKLFLPVGASQTTQIKAQLNPWMASLPSAFSAVTVV